jgi:hypothetical protein
MLVGTHLTATAAAAVVMVAAKAAAASALAVAGKLMAWEMQAAKSVWTEQT